MLCVFVYLAAAAGGCFHFSPPFSSPTMGIHLFAFPRFSRGQELRSQVCLPVCLSVCMSLTFFSLFATTIVWALRRWAFVEKVKKPHQHLTTMWPGTTEERELTPQLAPIVKANIHGRVSIGHDCFFSSTKKLSHVGGREKKKSLILKKAEVLTIMGLLDSVRG